MTEQKLNKYWALFRLCSSCYDDAKGTQLQLLLMDHFFPLQNMNTKKTCIKRKKTAQKHKPKY